MKLQTELYAAGLAAALFAAPAAAQLTTNEMNLVSAAQDCRVDEARRLIGYGTDVNVRNSGGYTPLMMAATYGCLEVAEMLLDNRADPSLEHDSFRDAAYMAKMNRNHKIVDLLEKRQGGGAAAQAPAQARATEPRARNAVASDRVPTDRTTAAKTGGATSFPKLGALQVGQRVIYSGTGGKTWEPGTIRSIDPKYGYNIEGTSGSNDPNFVVAPEREPFWTRYFVGDWRVSVPMAMGAVTDGTYIYRTVSGGLRLPPLRINADGTYSWRVQQGGGETLIRGRWEPSPAGPGVILKNGEQGADWLVYNNTRSLEGGEDSVILSSDCCTHYDGRRIK